MKLNVIKIKELRIKIYYFYKKKNYLKKILFIKNNKDNEKTNRDNEKTRIIH